ncbi:MAG: tryptophan 2,3-dioxygenase family protein [Ekhidna sp.]|nr:tryptophan 2,3-dioxygenase family protein [Ekhidna sp.]
MKKREIKYDVETLLRKLKEKYEAMGQDLSGYLDGLLYSDYLTYWDYIHLDTLLSLQSPRTAFPDERIFILYHQVTELYFRMILNEMEQAVFSDPIDASIFKKRLRRINRYFSHLIDSFDVMLDGMDQEQFLAFRMALLPASGFQSGQYRMIEIYATDFINLTDHASREQMDKNAPVADVYQYLYWKSGATELATGKKTLTLRQFEEKYRKQFIELGDKVKEKNLLRKFLMHYDDCKEIASELKNFDLKANVNWPLQHLKSAARYLHRDPSAIKASGGTNWQKYLPPRNQRIVFFPQLWTDADLSNWGKRFKEELSSHHD